MKKTTRAWVAKAEGDWRNAKILMRAKEKSFDGVCFHCQQSVEKFLKSLLEEIGSPIPRTHNLIDLQHILLPHYAQFKSFQRGLVFLKQFAVEFRYPGKNGTKRQATAAMRWAERVRQECRTLLGIIPPSKKTT